MTENKNKKSDEKSNFVIPTEDFLYDTPSLEYVLCKPKLLPLKSVTLEKLEKMQKEAEEKIKASREESEQEIEETEETKESTDD